MHPKIVRLGQRLCLAGGDQFAPALAAALRTLPPGTLPLLAGCTRGGMVDDGDLEVSVLTLMEEGGRVTARVGVFFSEVVGGCNCSEDPVANNAYCVLQVTFDRRSGLAEISPVGR